MPFVPQLRRLVRRWLRVAVPAAALAVIALAQPTGPSVAQTAGGPATAPARAVAPGAPITLNFKDADIDSVVGAFGHLLNRTFVIDPRVRGKITLETPRAVPASVAYELLQSALRVQGFAVVETGSIWRVVPEADAKLQAGPVAAGRANAGGGDQVVTQIFRLTYESASNLVPVLRPLISPNNTIVAYPNNNSLVITDYAANLQRLQRIIATLDSPASGEVEVVAMKHALATDVALQVSRLLDDQARAGGAQGATVDPGQRVTVLADTRINSILVRSASPARMNLAKSLITRLDQPSSEPGNIRVVYLRNAEATRLVQVLRGVLAGDSAGAGAFGTGGQGGAFGTNPQAGAFANAPGLAGSTANSPVSALGGPAGANSPATSALNAGQQGAGVTTIAAGGAVIAADPSTNSLIITAPEPIYRNLRAVIDKLDARRVQVYIESLIVEVSADRSMELGVQWQFLNQGSNAVGGTNLPARGSGANILDVATNILGVGRGLNVGVVSSKPILGSTSDGTAINLGFLARALETEAGANILATPNLVTLDNEEARIIIGQNVPFITGSFTNTGAAAGAVNPFQTIERRDVGTTLRVRPQVAEGGTVRMQIFQEVSSVQDATLAAGLITNKRAIESNVLVDDGQVVVLGGLIEERVEGGVSMVPGLGRVPILGNLFRKRPASPAPILGNLFRYDNRKRVKTNLLVCLRPVVLRNAEASFGITADRYDYIRQLQGTSAVTPSELMPERQFQPPAMSPMPPRPGQPGVAPPSVSPVINDAMPDRWRPVAPRPPGGAPAGHGAQGAGQAAPVPPAEQR
ncbi:MAG TPA: type II secretion system secretin GspD, partial [Burkholderiaceae bacterium]|nr:type II secretion system secretin GspD [Burkholderiaceae bacterium]